MQDIHFKTNHLKLLRKKHVDLDLKEEFDYAYEQITYLLLYLTSF